MKNTRLASRPMVLFKLLGVALGYALSSWLVLSFFGQATVFYLASGVALAAVLLGGRRYVWAIGWGALLANLLISGAFWGSVLMACGSALAAWLGAWLIWRDDRFNGYMPSLRDVTRVFVLGGLVATFLSAVVGATALWWQGSIHADGYLRRLLEWWMGDTLGVILLTPLILVWWSAVVKPSTRPPPKKVAEAVLVLTCTGLAAGVVFLGWGETLISLFAPPMLGEVAHDYWMFLFITWAAVRLSTRGTSLALLLVALVGVGGVLQGTGLAGHGPQDVAHLLSYWMYTVILSLSGLALATYIAASNKAAEALARSQAAVTQELKNTLSALDHHAIVATTDVQGRITSVNDRFCEVSGYTREELLGQDHRLLNSGYHPPGFFRAMYRAVASGQSWEAEICNRAKNGHLYWVRTSITPFMGHHGKPTMYVAIRTDITAHKHAEQALQHERSHLEERVQQQTASLQRSMEANKQALTELMQQKFVLDQHSIVTMSGMDGRIIYGNQKFSEISGYTPEEFMGQDHSVVSSGYHPKGFFKAMYDTIRRGEVWHAEVCNRAKDGHLYWVDTTVAAFMGQDGQPREYIAVRNDITKRKLAEEAAHAANQAKSEFLANMSHEIRTPMNGVVGMIDILQETELLPDQHRMLDTIHRSSLSLLNILNDILDFSKIEAGKLDVERIPTHLREVVEEVAQLMLTVASHKDTQIELFVDPTLPVWIFSDPTRLRQILLNLLGNALKFVAPGVGKVMLHVHPVRRADGVSCLQLCVLDNGIGMSEAVVARLFQPFTQADASTARKFGGTGLGLSITQGLVEMMQGQITVRSTLGQGSEFFVEFPLQAAPLPAGRQPDQALDLGAVCVLAVTASSACATVLQVYLSAAGAQVQVLADAQEALARAQQAPDGTLLLLDLAHAREADALQLSQTVWPPHVRVVSLVPRQGRGVALLDDEIATHPLLYHDLLEGVAVASGLLCRLNRAAFLSADHLAHTPVPTVAQALAADQLILMAEDNETNRDVLQAQLRLLGYQAEVAQDGVAALQMWRTGCYALLLTDCHMPHMDGFELTEAIRQSEPEGTRLPIIAITANAMQGEAERCRAHGMDDFLSKPLRLKELGPMLAKWLPQGTPLPPALPVHELAAPAEPAALAVWHAPALSELVGDDPAMHQRLLARFLLNAQEQVDAIEAAVAAGDNDALAGVAHTLKSAARTVGALALGELCQAMETAGRADEGATCRTLVAALRPSFQAAATAIGAHGALPPG